MEIKILCDCGVKFKFDVEPIDGRSPGAVQCPSCGRDQTEATNARIQEQLNPPRPVISVMAPAAPPAPPEQKKISVIAAAPAAPQTPNVAIPAVRIPGKDPAPGPKITVMPVPEATKALSVKPPGEHKEEAPAPSAPPPSGEPKSPGSPKMAYMPVPESTKLLSVKPPREHVEETPAPSASPARPSEPKAAGSPKMAYMPVPESTKSLSVKPPGEHTEETAQASAAAPASSEPRAAGSPKMAYMPVPESTKSLSVKPPGEHTEEAHAAPSSPPASGEPKAAGSPKMAYMPVPEATKSLSVKPPGEHVEEQGAPSQIASTSSAPGSPKMAKMDVPTGGTSLSVAGHAKKEDKAPEAPATASSPAPVAPAPVAAHPATARMTPPPRPASSSGGRGGIGILGAIIGSIVGAIIWYFIATNAKHHPVLSVIPAICAGFLARAFARRALQNVAIATVVIAGIVSIATMFLVVGAVNEKLYTRIIGLTYDSRMELAKKAASAKTDDEVRAVMVEDSDVEFSNASDINDEAVAKYRRNELAALQKFAKGDPSRAKFEQTQRAKIEADEDFPRVRVRWLGTILWVGTALGFAFRLAGGESKDK